MEYIWKRVGLYMARQTKFFAEWGRHAQLPVIYQGFPDTKAAWPELRELAFAFNLAQWTLLEVRGDARAEACRSAAVSRSANAG